MYFTCYSGGRWVALGCFVFAVCTQSQMAILITIERWGSHVLASGYFSAEEPRTDTEPVFHNRLGTILFVMLTWQLDRHKKHLAVHRVPGRVARMCCGVV